MSKRRSRLEILLSILSVVKGGHEKPTNIMYAVNRSWNPTQKMLSNMVEEGLLELRTALGLSRRRYAITEKGVNVLDYFMKANEIMPNNPYLVLAISS